MILEIVKYPSPVLKKKASPVGKVDRSIQELIENMFETMYAAPGVGLAAPQVGISQRILIIDVGRLENETYKPDPKVLINPVFKGKEGKIIWEEGCLSLPQLIIPVERSQKVVVEGLDRNGKPVTYLGEDLLAVALQHEIDHLDGILLIDRLSRLKRDLYKKKLEKNERPEKIGEEVERGSGRAYLG